MEKNTSETLYSLKFAERVRSVELGPGSRRAELVSWSSQEHLEVWGQHRPVSGGAGSETPSQGTACSRGQGKMPERLDLEPEPKPNSLFSPRMTSRLRGARGVIRWGVDRLQAGSQVPRGN